LIAVAAAAVREVAHLSHGGVVRATYQSSGDDPGNYTIVAVGDGGTSVRGIFIVTPG
jgi:hypothetical protein